MLQAIEQGESDPAVLAELAKGRLREKLPALRLALTGRMPSLITGLLIGELLDHIEYLERAIHRVEVSIAELPDRAGTRRADPADLARHRTRDGGSHHCGDRHGHAAFCE